MEFNAGQSVWRFTKNQRQSFNLVRLLKPARCSCYHSSMTRFTSPRERRLWLWTLLVLITIYATLGVVRPLAQFLNETSWSSLLFIAGCLLVLAAAVTQGMRQKPSQPELVVGLGITAVYLLLFVRISLPAERTHLVEYGIVALLVHEALSERRKNGGAIPFPVGTAVLLTTLLGTIDELIQAILPSRVFDLQDILFNFTAALLALSASTALAWARRRA